MRRILIFFVSLAIISCEKVTVVVSNPYDTERLPEMVELCLKTITTDLGIKEGQTFIIKDEVRNEVPYQITSDGKIIFQTSLTAKEESKYTIQIGKPSEYETIVFGKQYPERADDFAWENDLVGFRAYGPALQARGEKGFGYDLFAKRGTHLPVLEEIYSRETSREGWEKYHEMMKTDEVAANRFKFDSLSYHVDRGHGMDVYQVGPTLGAGVAALVEDGEIIYPWCYESYEILDNGPLRMRVRLTFTPLTVGYDTNVIETRIITLDAGSHLNHTSISYTGLSHEKEIVAGIVLQDKDGREISDVQNRLIAYPAPSINIDKSRIVDNGTHFVGHVFQSTPDYAKTVYFSDRESKEQRNGSKGHVLAGSKYQPGSEFTYWWGFGWNHSNIKDYEQWIRYLEAFSAQIKHPLSVEIK